MALYVRVRGSSAQDPAHSNGDESAPKTPTSPNVDLVGTINKLLKEVSQQNQHLQEIHKMQRDDGTRSSHSSSQAAAINRVGYLIVVDALFLGITQQAGLLIQDDVYPLKWCIWYPWYECIDPAVSLRLLAWSGLLLLLSILFSLFLLTEASYDSEMEVSNGLWHGRLFGLSLLLTMTAGFMTFFAWGTLTIIIASVERVATINDFNAPLFTFVAAFILFAIFLGVYYVCKYKYCDFSNKDAATVEQRDDRRTDEEQQ